MRLHLAILLAAIAALGAIAATVFVGSKVREDTVVAKPYEEGLHHDRERQASAALGWQVAPARAALGGAPLALEVTDRAGRPLAGATVAVTAARPGSGRGQLRAAAREVEPGRYVAEVPFPSAGAWDLEVEVRRGGDRARLAAAVEVSGDGACDLTRAPCTLDLGASRTLTLDLGPRPLRTMSELAVVARLEQGSAPLDGAAVKVGFEMPGMAMGPNVSALAGEGAGRYRGKAVLVRCPSGEKGWLARVTVTPPGGPELTATAPLEVTE